MRLLALLALALAGPLAAQVESRTVPPDEPGPPRRFARDTLVQRVELRGGTLEVVAERDSANAGATTGRYAVRWNGLHVTASEDTAGALPFVAAVIPGTPIVVVLAAPNHLKILVLEPARGLGGVAPRAFSVPTAGKATSDQVRIVDAPVAGAFALATPDFTLRYSAATLRLEAGSRSAAAGAGAGAALLASGESQYVASMKSDLRALVTAEEAYFAAQTKYSERLADLKLRLSEGNRLLRLRLTANGWTALMGNANTRTVCAAFVGATAAAPATKEGEPACI